MSKHALAVKLRPAKRRVHLDMHVSAGWPLLVDRSCGRSLTKVAISQIKPRLIISPEEDIDLLTGEEMMTRVKNWSDNLWGYRDAEFLLENQKLLPVILRGYKVMFLGAIWLHPVGERPITLFIGHEHDCWYPGFELLEYPRGAEYVLPDLL